MHCCHGDAGHATPEEIVLGGAIQMARVECFNESSPHSGRSVLKLECSRASKAAYCETPPGGDAELLLNIPFTASVRLRGLCVSGGEAPGGRPTRVRLFANSSLDIGECAAAAGTQELALPSADEGAEVWHSLRVAKFSTVTSLQLYFFTDGEGGGGGGGGGDPPPMRVYYVGLKAEVGAPKLGVVHAVYESRAQLADHKQAEGAAGGASLLH